ncbi:hypothetical protein FB451DRAFT_1089817 [Mycena latifolia]|nr:hypothetical protein FB451DRAFT_1089817 [Mycena latifolia]
MATMDTTNNPPDANVPGIAKLVSLMEEQIKVLHRIDERQAAADVSTQPIPQVPATSSSTWGALLRSRIAETIQPQVDRWRSGLDALLVFLGLFSAIVTSFLVTSLTGLQQDEAARTNELLANITDILIQLSAGTNAVSLHVPSPAPFQPDPVDIRLNSYWIISIVLSLSIAALAVACRGFLNMTTLSTKTTAADKLVDINRRWKAAEKMLGPALEVIPQLLVIPVILFIVGLLDSIFSSILALEVLPAPIAAALGLSLLFVAGVVVFLVFALVDASFRPDSSPFQSTLARFFSKLFKIDNVPAEDWLINVRRMTSMVSTYQDIVRATHDDEALDKAAATLRGMIEVTMGNDLDPRTFNDTVSYLLSPEASTRCNHTAAKVIVDLRDVFRPDRESALLYPIAEAARRSANYRPLATLWTSTYVKALAVVCGAFHEEHPPVVCILGSGSVDASTDGLDDLLLDIFFDYRHSVSPDGSLTPPLVKLFEPDFIVARHVLGFLSQNYERDKALVIISLLMTAKTPAVVIAAALAELNSRSVKFWTIYTGVVVVKCLLESSGTNLEDDGDLLAALGALCSACITVGKQIPWETWEMFHWSEVEQIIELALPQLPASPESAALREQFMEFKNQPLTLKIRAVPRASSILADS